MRYITNIILICAAVYLAVITYNAHQEIQRNKQETDAKFIQMMQKSDALRQEVERVQQEVSRGENRRWMEITAYTAGFESTGKGPGHPEYGLTATGYRLTDADAWKVAAADPRYYPPGTRVNVAGVGTVTIVDTGGAIKGPHRLDIFAGMTAVDEADMWGRQERQVVIE